MSTRREEDAVRPSRVGDDRLPVKEGSFSIDSPLVYAESDAINGQEFESSVAISYSTTLDHVFLNLVCNSDDVRTGHSVNMTAEQARDVAVTLWAAADTLEESNGGDSSP